MAMTMRLSASLGIAVLLASQAFADGQMETPGSPYVTVSGGWAYVANMSKVKWDVRNSSTTKGGDTETKRKAQTITQMDYEFGLGFDVAVAGAVGYDFGSFRLEGEVSHASADFSSKRTHQGSASADGDDDLKEAKLEALTSASTIDGGRFAATRLLANVYYDVETGTRFRPYVGIGVGAVHLLADPFLYGTVGWALAYQGLAGLGVELVEGVDIRLGYRFFGTTEASLERKLSTTSTTQDSKTTWEIVVTAKHPIALIHQIELGVRYGY